MTAHSLLSDPKHWTRGAFARDASGFRCDPSDPDAVTFDLVGAVARCHDLPVAGAYLRLAAAGVRFPALVNDRVSHCEVVALLAGVKL